MHTEPRTVPGDGFQGPYDGARGRAPWGPEGGRQQGVHVVDENDDPWQPKPVRILFVARAEEVLFVAVFVAGALAA